MLHNAVHMLQRLLSSRAGYIVDIYSLCYFQLNGHLLFILLSPLSMMLRIQILRVILNTAPPLFFIISEKKQQLKSLNQIRVSAEKKVSSSVEMSTRPQLAGAEEGGDDAEGGGAAFSTSPACVEIRGARSEGVGAGSLGGGAGSLGGGLGAEGGSSGAEAGDACAERGGACSEEGRAGTAEQGIGAEKDRAERDGDGTTGGCAGADRRGCVDDEGGNGAEGGGAGSVRRGCGDDGGGAGAEVGGGCAEEGGGGADRRGSGDYGVGDEAEGGGSDQEVERS